MLFRREADCLRCAFLFKMLRWHKSPIDEPCREQLAKLAGADDDPFPASCFGCHKEVWTPCVRAHELATQQNIFKRCGFFVLYHQGMTHDGAEQHLTRIWHEQLLKWAITAAICSVLTLIVTLIIA